MKIYYIHDNFDRPFLVEITDETLKGAYAFAQNRSLGRRVAPPEKYKVRIMRSVADGYAYGEPIVIEAAKKVFVGESPLDSMTRFSGGDGLRFKGNTILVEKSYNTYIHIGGCIKQFQALSYPIMEFVSPVGNNDVPYPWARDIDGNVYLIIEDVVMDKNCGWKETETNPYHYYYRHATMTKDLGGRWEPEHPYFQGIMGLKIGTESYTLKYAPHPAKHYDWIQSWREGDVIFEFTNGKQKTISKEEYVAIMDAYGAERGFYGFQTNKI